MKTLKEYLTEELVSIQKRIDSCDKTCKEYMSQYQANLGAKIMLEKTLEEKRKELANLE